MQIRNLVAVFMFGLITQAHAQLYCYVCENCPDGEALTDDLLVACGEEDTTQPIISTPTQPSTGVPTESTNSPTGSTIEATSVPNSEPTSELPSQPPSEPPSQPPSETPSDQPSQPPSEPTTILSTNPPSETPTEQSTIITTVATPGSPIPTTSMEPGTEITFSTSDMTTQTLPTEPPTTTDQAIGTPPLIVRVISSKQSDYNCFVIKKQVNNTQQVYRGCVPASPNYNEMCVKANDNITPLECSICATDQCNSGNYEIGAGSTIIMSLTLVLCSIFTIANL